MAPYLLHRLRLVLLMLIATGNSGYAQTSSAATVDAGAFHHQDNVTFFSQQDISDNDIEKLVKQAKNEQVAAPQPQEEKMIYIKNKQEFPAKLLKQLEQLEKNKGNKADQPAHDTSSTAIMQVHKADLLIDREGNVVAAKAEGGSKLSRFMFLRDHCLNTSYSEPMGDVQYGYLKKEGSARTKLLKADGERIQVLDVTFLD